ncbi:MAG: NUDIX hydrolase [Leptospiraceae bacterium]|nr:NUDIX hydrolase [Leptospiraceae bacterium]MCP5502384.1 NUDIX hydrolase [Leptospiraceae bacterium]
MNKEDFLNSLKYKQWLDSLIKEGNRIDKVDVLNSVHKSNGESLFGLVKVDAITPEGKKLLPIALIRGHFVCILVCIKEKESGEEFFLLVEQRRIADGSLFYEFPAGMCDSEADPQLVALKEMEEETGLKIQKKDLILLCEKGLHTSPGLLDEKGFFFACDLEMTTKELQSFHNRKTGAEEENEHITTKLCKEDEVLRLIKNTNGYLLYFLYKHRKNAGNS